MSGIRHLQPLGRTASYAGQASSDPQRVRRHSLRRGAALALVITSAWGATSLGAADPASAGPASSVQLLELRGLERLIDEGKLDEASAALDRKIESEGATARTLLLRGLILYRQENFRDALPALQQSFSLDETDPDVSKTLGLCLVKLGREDLAETFFEIAVRLAPRDAMAHYYLGLNAYTTKRFEAAARAFENATVLQPDSVPARSFLGRSHEAIGSTDLAREQYSQANALNRAKPTRSAEPPLLMGSMLFRQGEFDGAERHLAEALEFDQESALAHYWMGLLLEQKKALPEAIRALRRAAELAPADHRPHYALARIYRRAGDERRAADSVRRFRELRARSESETF